jgi:hypothetical protein
MYTELQTFSVAMEALIQNDPNSAKLSKTNDYLIQVLAKSNFYGHFMVQLMCTQLYIAVCIKTCNYLKYFKI